LYTICSEYFFSGLLWMLTIDRKTELFCIFLDAMHIFRYVFSITVYINIDWCNRSFDIIISNMHLVSQNFVSINSKQKKEQLISSVGTSSKGWHRHLIDETNKRLNNKGCEQFISIQLVKIFMRFYFIIVFFFYYRQLYYWSID